MYLCLSVCMYVCMYVRAYVRMYTYIHTCLRKHERPCNDSCENLDNAEGHIEALHNRIEDSCFPRKLLN